MLQGDTSTYSGLPMLTGRTANMYQSYNQTEPEDGYPREIYWNEASPAEFPLPEVQKKCIRRAELRVVHFFAQQRVQEGFRRGFLAPATGLNGDEDSIDFRKLFRIVKSHYPTAIGFVIHV